MNIKCKYALGDTVYYMKSNAVHSGTIKEIRVRTYLDWEGSSLPLSKTKTNISYDTENTKDLDEDKIFKTKEELLNSL